MKKKKRIKKFYLIYLTIIMIKYIMIILMIQMIYYHKTLQKNININQNNKEIQKYFSYFNNFRLKNKLIKNKKLILIYKNLKKFKIN